MPNYSALFPTGGGGGETTVTRTYVSEATPDLIDWLGNWGEVSYINPAKNHRLGMFSPFTAINTAACGSTGATASGYNREQKLFDRSSPDPNLSIGNYNSFSHLTTKNSTNYQLYGTIKASLTCIFPPGVTIIPNKLGLKTSYTEVVSNNQYWAAPQTLLVLGLIRVDGRLKRKLIDTITTGFTDQIAAIAGAVEFAAWDLSNIGRLDGIEIVCTSQGTSGGNSAANDPTWIPIQFMGLWGSLYYADTASPPDSWKAWEDAMVADPDLSRFWIAGQFSHYLKNGLSGLITQTNVLNLGASVATTTSLARVTHAITENGIGLDFSGKYPITITDATATLNATAWGIVLVISTEKVGKDQGLVIAVNSSQVYETNSTGNRMPMRAKINATGTVTIEYRDTTTALLTTSPSEWGSPTASITSTATVDDGNVHFLHINLTASGNMELIIDGTSEGTVGIGTYTTTGIYFHLGRFGCTDVGEPAWFEGSVHAFGVYLGPGIPSAADALSLYNTWAA